MIIHQKMSLFSAPRGVYLVHACNGQGVWGAGIAAEFAKRFPRAKGEYAEYCLTFNRYERPITGTAFITIENGYSIGCLITSLGFGAHRDSKKVIKVNTTLALKKFCDRVNARHEGEKVVVYSNKFNSGLFGVPWEDSEVILKEVLKFYPNIEWVVCDLK